MGFGMQNSPETNDLLHVLGKFETLMILQLFCRQPLIHELFLKVEIAKGIQQNVIFFSKYLEKW